MILKDCEYGGSRVTFLQLWGKRMGEEVFLGLFLVRLQGGLEDCFEA